MDQVSSDLKTTVLEYLAQVSEASLEQVFEATQIPKNSLYKTLSRLVRDNMITKAGHQRKVVYKRSIGLIGLSDESDEANLSAEPEHTHQSDQVQRTSPQSDQFEPQSDQSVIIRTGDRVTYCGGVRSLVRLCSTKHLEVLEANTESATVKHSGWLVTQTVPLTDLRRV